MEEIIDIHAKTKQKSKEKPKIMKYEKSIDSWRREWNWSFHR